MVELLLGKGADLNVEDNDGQTPLEYAVLCGQESVSPCPPQITTQPSLQPYPLTINGLVEVPYDVIVKLIEYERVLLIVIKGHRVHVCSAGTAQIPHAVIPPPRCGRTAFGSFMWSLQSR